ncbi:MAG TPA: vitamin K epoxide reductase family protein [Opitutaceae bacterium]
MITVPQRASSTATALVGLGLLTCVYLAALKLLNLPCPLSGCASIINTHYGALFGVPLPIYAVPLWLTLTLPGTRPWQNAVQLLSLLALALGALALMGIQFLVLKGFCPFCTIHAAAAIASAFVVPMKGRAHAWLSPAVLALVLPIFLVVKILGQADAQSWNTPEEVPAAEAAAAAPTPTAGAAAVPGPAVIPASVDKAALTWLGDFDPKTSPILVVSFQCSHCLDLLEQTLTRPRIGTLKGPKIFVYSTHGSSADTIAVLAAILAQPGTPQEQFAAVFAQQDTFRDALITHDSAELKKHLSELFPGYESKLEAAKQLHNLQVVALKFIQGRGSPFLLFPDGKTKFGGDVTPDMLFR